MAEYTRSKIFHPVFGYPGPIPENQLPTKLDLYNHYRMLRNENSKSTRDDIAKELTEVIVRIYEKSSIPTISEIKIKQYINSCVIERAKYHGKSIQNKQQPDRIQDIISEFNVLFDISSCKCPIEEGNCFCSFDKKIPGREWPFLLDQRNARKLFISSLDRSTTSKNISTQKRKEAQFEREERELKRQLLDQPSQEFLECDFEEVESYQPSTSNNNKYTRNHYQLRNLAVMCDRYQISDRAGAAIANAVLQDYGIITPDENSLIIDRNKLHRSRFSVRRDLANEAHKNISDISAIYFDGRKDPTRVLVEREDGNLHQDTANEEHYTVLSEPGNQYIAHLTPSSGKAKDITRELVDLCRERNSDLKAVGADGARVNTGVHNGCIRLLELEFSKPLHWFICQLHGNELALRHLFERIDGKTSGPNSFKGVIGKELHSDFTSKPIVVYDPICGKTQYINCDVLNNLSTDQKYLYNICHAVQSGICSSELASMKPGPIHHARWTTLANRLLRTYISTIHPTPELSRIVHFIVNYYAPVWFRIKSKPICTDGPKNMFYAISLLRELPEYDQKVISDVLQRNAYFCHPENLLLSMLADSDMHIRQKAVKTILDIRTKISSSFGQIEIRSFNIPSIRFTAETYVHMIDWETSLITEPPFTKHLSEEILLNSVCTPMEIPSYPCHTQAVERTIQLVTKASSSVTGEEARHGLILSTLTSREKMPTFESKKDYTC